MQQKSMKIPNIQDEAQPPPPSNQAIAMTNTKFST
jgi:hypothetical protein